MKQPFDCIQYGPFQTKYHRKAVNNKFKKHLVDYLEKELLPQVTINFNEVSGSLNAYVDHERHCGPNSAIKNIYMLIFEFICQDDKEDIAQDLIYYPKTGIWKPRWNKPLELQTIKLKLDSAKRKRLYEYFRKKFMSICLQVLDGQINSANCPVCNKPLTITNNNELFHIRCTDECVSEYQPRNPETGEFLGCCIGLQITNKYDLNMELPET